MSGGSSDTRPVSSAVAPVGITLSQGIEMAKGQLWQGVSIETTAWQRMAHIVEILPPATRLEDIDILFVGRVKLALLKRGKSPATVNR